MRRRTTWSTSRRGAVGGAQRAPPRALLLVELPRAPSDIAPPLRCSRNLPPVVALPFPAGAADEAKGSPKMAAGSAQTPFVAPSSAKKSASTQTFSVSPSRSQFLRRRRNAQRRLGERQVRRGGREEARVENLMRRVARERARRGRAPVAASWWSLRAVKVAKGRRSDGVRCSSRLCCVVVVKELRRPVCRAPAADRWADCCVSVLTLAGRRSPRFASTRLRRAPGP